MFGNSGSSCKTPSVGIAFGSCMSVFTGMVQHNSNIFRLVYYPWFNISFMFTGLPLSLYLTDCSCAGFPLKANNRGWNFVLTHRVCNRSVSLFKAHRDTLVAGAGDTTFLAAFFSHFFQDIHTKTSVVLSGDCWSKLFKSRPAGTEITWLNITGPICPQVLTLRAWSIKIPDKEH